MMIWYYASQKYPNDFPGMLYWNSTSCAIWWRCKINLKPELKLQGNHSLKGKRDVFPIAVSCFTF